MSNDKKFEEDEEALFSDDDTTADSPSKGLRLISWKKMSDFTAWLYDVHPEIRGIDQLDYQNILSLVKNFEHSISSKSDYTAEEWLRSLQQF